MKEVFIKEGVFIHDLGDVEVKDSFKIIFPTTNAVKVKAFCGCTKAIVSSKYLTIVYEVPKFSNETTVNRQMFEKRVEVEYITKEKKTFTILGVKTRK
jgi:hypothetical protein